MGNIDNDDDDDDSDYDCEDNSDSGHDFHRFSQAQKRSPQVIYSYWPYLNNKIGGFHLKSSLPCWWTKTKERHTVQNIVVLKIERYGKWAPDVQYQRRMLQTAAMLGVLIFIITRKIILPERSRPQRMFSPHLYPDSLYGRAYADIITKISRIDRFPKIWYARRSSAIIEMLLYHSSFNQNQGLTGIFSFIVTSLG